MTIINFLFVPIRSIKNDLYLSVNYVIKSETDFISKKNNETSNACYENIIFKNKET